MKNVLTLRLPDELKKDLETISKQEKRPLSQLIRESVERYVAVRQYKRLRRKVLPFAESQGLVTDEDIFKALKK